MIATPMDAFRIQIEGGVHVATEAIPNRSVTMVTPDGPRALCVTWQLRSTYMFAIYFCATCRDGYSFQMELCAFCLLTLVYGNDTGVSFFSCIFQLLSIPLLRPKIGNVQEGSNIIN